MRNRLFSFNSPELADIMIALQFEQLEIDWSQIAAKYKRINEYGGKDILIDGVPFYEYYSLTSDQNKDWRQKALEVLESNVKYFTKKRANRWLDSFEFMYGLRITN